ncbi:MAG: type II secretion system protein [Candidatus Acidiferrales bacterium]
MIRRLQLAKARIARGGTSQGGFTLIELMVVITIILILASIAAGQYQKTVLRAKETKLKSELQVMRKAIQDYTMDKECGPSSLDDLVSNNYLSRIPEDPMTNTADWVTKSDDVGYSPEQTCYGITDVNSASDKVSPFTNTAYSSW